MTVTTMMHASETGAPAHHTANGFRNPFPGFEEKGFVDVLQWQLDRMRGKSPKKPKAYRFDMAENDGKCLRDNRADFTVTWIGHSTLLLQMQGMNILTDPMWSERCSPVGFAGPKRYVDPGIKFEDLPGIDIVLISHDHYDHLDKPTIRRLDDKPFYLVPLGVGAFLQQQGIRRFKELDWGDKTTIDEIDFYCTPAQHFSGRALKGRNKTLWCSWAVKGQSGSFYYTGDTGYFDGIKEIGNTLGPFDLVAVPIGAYLPRWFMRGVHVDPAEAVQVYLDLQGKIFVPIHWGTFDLADEPLDEPPRLLFEEVEKQGLDKSLFWQLKHGETRIISSDEGERMAIAAEVQEEK